MTKTLTEQQIRKIIEKGTLKAAKVCKEKFYGKPKSLTEQWREGTLESGFYYVTSGWSTSIEIRCLGNWFFEGNIKVISAVPSYDKVKEMTQKIERLEFDNEALDMSYSQAKEIIVKLEKQLEIASKALKKYQEAIKRFEKDPMNNIIMLAHQLIYDIGIDSKKTLKEMEGVK